MVNNGNLLHRGSFYFYIYSSGIVKLMMSNSFYTILLPVTTNNRFKPTVQNKIMFFDSLNSYVFFLLNNKCKIIIFRV